MQFVHNGVATRVVTMISFGRVILLGHDFDLAVHRVLLVYRVIFLGINVIHDDCPPCSLRSVDVLVTAILGVCRCVIQFFYAISLNIVSLWSKKVQFGSGSRSC